MPSTNDITGDEIKSKLNSDAYRDNYDAIFGKRKSDVMLTKEQQAAVDDTAGISQDNKGEQR